MECADLFRAALQSGYCAGLPLVCFRTSLLGTGQDTVYGVRMCRNIKTLFNFAPPATEEEIQASALQFVRKLSGFNRPSKTNEAAFNRAVEQVSEAARLLIHSLVTA